MKKLYSLSFAAVAALMLFSSCSKDEVKNPVQDPEEVAPVAEKVTISVSMPDEGLTKVTLTQDAENKKVITLAWEYTDELEINGNTFTVKTGSISGDGKSAEFEGTAPAPDGAGKYTIRYSNLAGGYAEQTQSEDGDASHLGYEVSISGADSYTGITFSEAGASAVGGTFSQSSVLRLRAKLPDAVASAVQKVIFKASESVFAGAKELTVNLSTPGTAGDDKTLDVYATLPVGDAINADVMDLLIQFQTSANAYDKYTAYRQIPASTNFGTPQYIGIDCSNIDKYAGKDDDGTAAHPYLIGDQHQMQAINGLMASGETKYFKLIDDIDLTGVAWTSVNSASPYDKALDFEGNGKTLSNLCNSLFYDLNGTVKNFFVSNANISNESKNFGVLARMISIGGIVRGVSISDSNVTLTKAEGAGGLIGKITNSAEIEDVHILNTSVTANTNRAGGIAGWVVLSSAATVALSKCSFEGGSVTTKTSYYSGGLIGSNESTAGILSIGNSFSTGDVTALANNWAGGILGCHAKGTSLLTDCYSISAVNSSQGSGGIVGLSSGAGLSVIRCMAFNTSITSTVKSGNYHSSGAIIGKGNPSIAIEVNYCYRSSGITYSSNVVDNTSMTDMEFISPAAALPQAGTTNANARCHHGQETTQTLSALVQDASKVGVAWSGEIWDFSGSEPVFK